MHRDVAAMKWIDTMENHTPVRRSFAWRTGLVLVVAGLAIVAARLAPAKERATLAPTLPPARNDRNTPPMDANTPAHTETATFALG